QRLPALVRDLQRRDLHRAVLRPPCCLTEFKRNFLMYSKAICFGTLMFLNTRIPGSMSTYVVTRLMQAYGGSGYVYRLGHCGGSIGECSSCTKISQWLVAYSKAQTRHEPA